MTKFISLSQKYSLPITVVGVWVWLVFGSAEALNAPLTMRGALFFLWVALTSLLTHRPTLAKEEA